ncbi:ankyrin repeat domain-containing protein [Pontiellaceae bacterium B1224]|nr:ankyrin repeat domain-containing protein [Pontiellaceae bacterium B1224]
MRSIFRNGCLIALILLFAGCGVKKPVDTSDPAVSIKWIDSVLEKSAAAPQNNATISQLQQVREHAELLKADHTNTPEVITFIEDRQSQLAGIPQQVMSISIQTGNADAFQWALDLKPATAPQYPELLTIWKRGLKWVTPTLANYPETLSVFMSAAVDDRLVSFFNEHAAEFKAGGYALTPPLQQDEFMVRYNSLIAKELEKAVGEKDRDRIDFLIDHTASLESIRYSGAQTKQQMQTFSDYVLYDLRDEAFACKLIEMGYEFNNLDLDRLQFSNAFAQTLRANPEVAVRALSLDRKGPPLSRSQARFLINLPISELSNLNEQYVDEAAQMCLASGGSSQAQEFIKLRATRKPFERADYVELLSWAVRYNDQALFQLVKQHGDGVGLQDLDLNVLAYNQRIFERYAADLLENIQYTMDDEPVDGGITLGQIYEIFQNENQDAGLYIVKNYDLAEEWLNATDERTLLMDVCRAGNLAAARHLIERRREDPKEETRFSQQQTTLFGSSSASEGKLSPIFFAAQSGNSDLIKYLESRGADVNARSNFGATPLMYAVSSGQLEATRTLIALGADVNARMDESDKDYISDGRLSYTQLSTVMNRAQAGKNQDIIDLLQKAGAR